MASAVRGFFLINHRFQNGFAQVDGRGIFRDFFSHGIDQLNGAAPGNFQHFPGTM